jgi:hypothetical protein
LPPLAFLADTCQGICRPFDATPQASPAAKHAGKMIVITVKALNIRVYVISNMSIIDI